MDNSLSYLMDKAIEIIHEAETIYIGSHVKPDGDNIGSLLALGMALKKLNKDIKILKVDNIPDYYKFLPNIELIMDYEIRKNLDLFIALDSSDMERLGVGGQFAKSANTVINIDHHISNTDFGDINIVSPSAAATGELVFEFIKKMEIEIDVDIATCLYTAISTDTGSFIYSNTSSRTHLMAAELIETGIDISDININLYQKKSLEGTRLLIDVLKGMEMYFDNRLGIAIVTQDILKNNNAKMEDTEGIISFIRDIDTVETACLLKEMDENEIKVSLRSKEWVDVSEICTKFKGGGHKKAAGCTLYMELDEAKKAIIEEIEIVYR